MNNERRTPRHHTDMFKLEIVKEVLIGNHTIASISNKQDVSSGLVSRWCSHFMGYKLIKIGSEAENNSLQDKEEKDKLKAEIVHLKNIITACKKLLDGNKHEIMIISTDLENSR